MRTTPHKRRTPKGSTIAERLDLHSVKAPSGCWIWLGATNKAGYGRIQIEGRTAYAHRASYEAHVGPIPKGLTIDHLCRRPRCIRPDHLQAVTPRVNVQRGTSPGARAQRRDQCPHGHSYAEHSVVYGGRRYCRTCQAAYSREWTRLGAGEIAARKAAGGPVVDLAAIFAAERAA